MASKTLIVEENHIFLKFFRNNIMKILIMNENMLLFNN